MIKFKIAKKNQIGYIIVVFILFKYKNRLTIYEDCNKDIN